MRGARGTQPHQRQCPCAPPWCHDYNYMACWAADRETALAKAYEMAQRAVTLDETDSFAQHTTGSCTCRHGKRPGAIGDRKGHRTQPKRSSRRGATTECFPFRERQNRGRHRANPPGQAPKSIRHPRGALEQGIHCFTARRYDEAIAALRQARNPINEVRGWLERATPKPGACRKPGQPWKSSAGRGNRMAVFPGLQDQGLGALWHGALEYRYQKDFDHLLRPSAKRASRTSALRKLISLWPTPLGNIASTTATTPRPRISIRAHRGSTWRTGCRAPI